MSSEQTLSGRRIPRRLWPIVAQPRDTEAIAKVRAWLAADSPSLVLSGGCGCGKTLAASWALAHHGDGGAFVRAVQLGRFAPWDELVLDAVLPDWPWRIELTRTPLLVLDDLGAESNPERIRATVQELIDARTDNWLRTIITTNLPLKANGRQTFGQAYGEPIMSRLRAGGIVHVGGEDLRPRRDAAPKLVEPSMTDEPEGEPIGLEKMQELVEGLREKLTNGVH